MTTAFVKREATYFINQEQLDDLEFYEGAFLSLGNAAKNLFVNRQIGYGKNNIAKNAYYLHIGGESIRLTAEQAELLREHGYSIAERPPTLEDQLGDIVGHAIEKQERILNLLKSGEWKDTLGDENAEGIEDSAMDTAVYMFIFVLLLRGHWGRLELASRSGEGS